MLQALPTRSGLLPDARHLVLPAGIVASGFPSVQQVCRSIGIEFDRWQEDLNTAILAKAANGLYAADTVAMSICRQAGKTFDVGGLVFADSIIHPGSTSVWTAHRFKVARETFNELRAWAQTPKLAPHIDYEAITTAAGNESIPFRNGSRIVFAAREHGSIRGFTKVRRLIVDEGQILTTGAMSDLAPTMNQAENPQLILMGTPPKPADPGEIFTGMRTEALAGRSENLLYVEFSPPPDVDLDDRQGWRAANPSFPRRTPERAIVRLRNMLPDDDFAREALGIWDVVRGRRVISSAAWTACRDEWSLAADRLALAVDVSPDRSRASVALAGQRGDGDWHVELDEQDSGTDWIVDHVARRLEGNTIRAVVVDGASPAASLLSDFDRKKIRVTVTDVGAMKQACGAFYDGATLGWLHHIDQHQLNSALGAAGKRDIGDGGWAWSRKSSALDITALVAGTLALWGAQAPASKIVRPGRGLGRTAGGRRATVLA